jgi:hypothetical protein
VTSVFDPPLSAASLSIDFVLDGERQATPNARSPIRTSTAPTPGFTLRGASEDAAPTAAAPDTAAGPGGNAAPAGNAATAGR